MEMSSITKQGDQREAYIVNVRYLYSVILALMPVTMIWNIPIVNTGVAVACLGLFAPYALFSNRSMACRVSILPFAVLIAYFVLRSNGSFANQLLLVFVLIHIFGATRGSINVAVVRKTLETVAVIATACVILQTVLYYLLGIKLWLLIPSLIREEDRTYFTKEMGSLYRPSAFFLEPSHYTQYCCLGLLTTLFPNGDKKVNMKKALWIMLGCILTTSGIGIALCVGVFGWYLLFTKRRNGEKVISLFGWGAAAVVAFFILMQIPFFSLSVQRIFGEVDGYNAIWGRTLFWRKYVTPLSGNEVFFGVGVADTGGDFITGLIQILYWYGYTGAAFMLVAILYLFIKSKNQICRCMCVMYCGLAYVANLLNMPLLTTWMVLMITFAMEKKQIAGTKEIQLY